MCGIVGIFDPLSKFQNKKKIIRDLNIIQTHRGPDDQGYYDDNLVSLGFRRLSIIDLINGNQPIIKNNIITIFNGEIYNYLELRKELSKIGAKFETESDSEVVANSYLFWGIECLKKFDGMFSICFYDKQKKVLILVRDRMGIKPLHYTFINGSLFFASEFLTLAQIPGFKKEINFNAVSSYLSFRYPVNDNELFFNNINRIESGSYLMVDTEKNSKAKVEKYWELPKVEAGVHIPSFEEAEEKLDFLLQNSVRKQLVSDVPLGVLLSGGLDSSLISSIASKFKNDLHTFSVSFSEKEYDESKKAKIVSDFIGSKHRDVKVDRNLFLNNLDTVIKIKGAPASIPHEFALYYLSKEIKKDVSVLLSGEGADEFFGGYSRVQKSPFDFHLKEFFNPKFSEENFYNFFLGRYKWFSINEKNTLFSDDTKRMINEDAVYNPYKSIFKKIKKKDTYNSILESFQKNHIKSLLERLDIMTMSTGIEARVPFLDHNILEFINNLPFNYKIKWKSNFHKFLSIFSNSEKYTEKNDINKILLRSCSKKYLPRSTVSEKKLGFPLPMNEWMKDKKIQEIFLDNSTLSRGIFDKKKLIELNENNNKSMFNQNYDFSGKKIWMLVNLELWMREFF